MDETLASLKQAFGRYREEIEAYERKSKPTDGLLGFGRSLKDDACHERFDERVAQAVREMCAAQPAPDTAERAVRLLILRGDAAHLRRDPVPVQAFRLPAQLPRPRPDISRGKTGALKAGLAVKAGQDQQQ